MTETKKYVRILKAPNKSSWYANKIGQVFEVDREGYTYLIRKGPHHLTAIRKEDAELIVTEKRPAKVGDKVLILDDFNEPRYMLHDVVPVIGGVDEHGVAVRKSGEWPIFLNNEQYEVLVNNEVENEEADEMERYEDAVKNARDAIEELRIAAYSKGYEDARRELMAQAPVEKTAQERRDEIVEQAKADIEGLKTDYSYAVPDSIDPDHPRFCFAEFIVDNEKRTIVALLRGNLSCRVYARGIAKAAPDDCFNVHIGKAIALHRALGLEVPDEYLNTPQPTEVRVGDVICTPHGSMHKVNKRHINEISDSYLSRCKIIDDSRTEVGE
ncbi:hypothetical protein KM903_04825 [Bacillus glycinifermentans]|uniref:hypothetical protein n=1 Tax=Bacillus glycinifermentans TaxID=1664069 RepID=UPI001C21332E|nr:hypothetical protein [Bacillus glycinifermentans]MBU8785736.1 hypothetical protein [Bacillus glycinifermentans]